MKVTQSALLSSSQAAEAKKLGAAFARLRIARGMKQDQAALRAGLSRNSAYRLEKGDPGLAMCPILRCLRAMVSGRTLPELRSESDSASASFFLQAEDGMRDLTVTGVQTCALPI